MKIGILTFHRARNFGAVLQCYALQETLFQLGYDVKVIDYRQPTIEKLYLPFSWDLFKKNFLYIVRSLFRRPKNYIPILKFYSFSKNHLKLSAPVYSAESMPQDYDVYIVGSDQVWGLNCTEFADDVYFGKFKKKKEAIIIGYAISTNEYSLKKIGEESLLNYANNFKILSFRESPVADYFNKMGIKSRIDIDPTLLADKKVWNNLVNEKYKTQNYIITHFNRGSNEQILLLNKKAINIAEQLNCKVVNLSDYADSPVDFISLIKYSKYVITTSFHCIAFSLIFERNFYAVNLDDGLDSRQKELLMKINLDEVLVDVNFVPSIRNINYKNVNMDLERMRQNSLDYLKNIKYI